MRMRCENGNEGNERGKNPHEVHATCENEMYECFE